MSHFTEEIECRTVKWLARQRYLGDVKAGGGWERPVMLSQQYDCRVHILQNLLVLRNQVADCIVGERKTHDEKISI